VTKGFSTAEAAHPIHKGTTFITQTLTPIKVLLSMLILYTKMQWDTYAMMKNVITAGNAKIMSFILVFALPLIGILSK
jgi:hypothetical protein